MTYEKCQRCGRALKNEASRDVGYGKTCLKKLEAGRQLSLELKEKKTDENRQV